MKRILYSFFVVMQVITISYAQIDLLKDINPGVMVPEMESAALYHGFIYYGADELWRTDGTEDGTTLIKDIQPGGGSFPGGFFIFNDLLYFSAVDSHGRELWRTDGTAAGTVMVADINPGSGGSNPGDYVSNNGKFFFHATTAANGRELWVSDGTTAGTTLVSDINPGPGNSTSQFDQANVITSFLGSIYFGGEDGTPGAELWKTDGTSGGTVLVKDLHDSIADTHIEFLLAVGSKLFMSAPDGHSARIWTSDGSTAGTQPLGNMSINAAGNIYPTYRQVRDNYLFFGGAEGSSLNWELWKTDGTLANTQLIADINGDPSVSSVPINLTFVGTTLYFGARRTSDFNSAQNLYKSNGEPGNFSMVSDQFEPGYGPMNIQEFNGLVTFTSRSKLGWYDGSVVRFQEAGLAGNQDINTFVELNDVLYFSPTGLNRFDGTTVSKVGSTTVHSSNPSSFTDAGGGITYFAADDGVHGMELWKSNGIGDASMVKDINPSGASNPSQFKMYNGKLYFAANDGVNGIELWKSDGTEAGTVFLGDLSQGGDSQPKSLTIYHGALYFTTLQAIWKISGESAPELMFGVSGSSSLTATTDFLYFIGFDNAMAVCALYKSDGTQAGTTIINNNIPGCYGPNGPTATLIPMESKIYFQGQTSFQPELWVYDGVTTAPVRPYAEGGPGEPGNFTVVGNTLFFGGSDAVHGYELWKSDGTAANTVIVKDIKAGTSSSLYTPAGHGPPAPPKFSRIEFDGKLFFTADDGTNGYELWVSDGTESGTVMLNNLAPGSTSGNPSNFVVLDSALYFLGADTFVPIFPNNFYVTNGLSCGTRKITSPVYSSSAAKNLTAVGSKLFVSLNDVRIGQEPFIIDPSQIPPPPEGCGSPPPPPFTQPTALVFSDVKNTEMTVSFTASTKPGAGYITLMRAGQPPYPNDVPVDGTAYQEGSMIGSSIVVGVGPATSYRVKHLTKETTYYFDVFSYGDGFDYLTTNPLAGSQRTAKDDSSTAEIAFPTVTENTITISITPSDPPATGYITLMKVSGYPTDMPQDGSTYNVGSSVGSSRVVGFGSGTTVNVTSLQPGTEYFFTVYPYMQSGTSYDYITTAPIQAKKETIGVTTSVAASKEERIAYPNPFTDALTIPFLTSRDNTQVHVIIYDQVGRVIAEVTNTTFASGDHEVTWDRTDTQGNKVQAGMYLYQVRSADAGKVIQGLVVAK
jgi:ELWxxDGT repeat protein